MTAIEVSRPAHDEIVRRGVFHWPVWTKEASRFDWSYDRTEECYLLEGRVVVETADGSCEFGAGDFVVFPAGLSCVWNVIEPVRKHYSFR